MFSRVFGLLIRGNLRGLLSFFLGIALLGALWNASLFRLSSHDSAVGMMTQVGVQVLNPVLTNPLAKSQFSSLSSSGFATFQKNCTGETSAIPGFGQEVKVSCADIKGATKLDDALPALYGAVAEAYYQHGATGVFDVPGPLQALLSGKSIVPDISTVPGTSVQVPHLPDNPLLQVGSAFGFSLGTLTAAGNADEWNKTLWFGGAALALLLLLGLTSKGGKRISAMGHALIGGAIPGLVILGAVQFILSRLNPDQAAVFKPLLGFVNGAFAPVYIGAAVLGVLLYVAAFVWRRVSQSMAEGRQAEAVPVGAGVRARGGEAGGGGYGQPAPRYTPPSPAAPQYPPRYPQPDPWAPPAPGGQGSYGQRPAPSYGEQQPYGGQPGYGGQRQPSYGGQQQYGGQAPYGGQQPPRDQPSYGGQQPPRDQPSYGGQSPYPPSRSDQRGPRQSWEDDEEQWPPRR